MGEKKPEKKTLYSYIIHPDLEPGVIDNKMLTRCILEYGPSDEAGRLFAEEGVHLNEAPIVRIEFHNIIRIDHLWMLRNLTKLTLAHNIIEKIENLEQLTNLNELDLSFNKIEKIENLDTLVKLEILSLFHNKIRKLENLEALEDLLVFSIGDNLIEDYKEMAYLRKFRKLRSVSFKGNPCCDDPMSYQFLWSALPRVTFLDYVLIQEEQRENGRAIFRGLIRKMDEADEMAEAARLAKEAYEAQVQFYAMSFVEYLSGSELLETMFSKDPDGLLLMTFGGELIPCYENYKVDYVETMSELVEFAQDAYNVRQNEIKLFKDLIDSALEDSVRRSQAEILEYENKKKPLVESVKESAELYRSKKLSQEDLEPKLLELSEQFNDIAYEVWKKLMTIEMRLYEQCEESRVQFGVNMTEMVTKLLEKSRGAFGAWREFDGVWSMKVFEILSKNFSNKAMLLDASPNLIEVMSDRDVLVNAIASSSDAHMRFIDDREDVLTRRANDWRDEIVAGTNEKEVKRNRDRILEINYFVDNEREDWSDLQMGIIDVPDPETVGLLMDAELC